jgi:ribose/xylose/arabinose/galactoside ABC-type transport system permease subunit
MKKYSTVIITLVLFIALYAVGGFMFKGFMSPQVFLNLLIDNAFLIVTAVGMTMVLIIGGIDLSVGAVIAFSGMLCSYMIEIRHVNWGIAVVIVLICGCLFGFGMGCMIHFLKVQPFIATLGGMYLARGLCSVISEESISITNKAFTKISQYQIRLPGNNYITINVVIMLMVFAVMIYIAHYTKFGRSVYAVGGSETSAKLMGINVGKVKILVYTLNGLCSAIAGIIYTLYTSSGYPLAGVGLEMDAIASAVIGGTLITGGVGMVAGTIIGVSIYGIIQTLITFQGTLNSWWTRIAIAFLLCVFIIIQRVLVIRREKAKTNIRFVESKAKSHSA